MRGLNPPPPGNKPGQRAAYYNENYGNYHHYANAAGPPA